MLSVLINNIFNISYIVLIQLIFAIIHCHFLLFFFFYNVEIISYIPLMNICISRSNYCVFNSINKGLIHLILVSQIWHSVTFWSIRISTKSLFLPSFCLLSSFDPLFIVCKLFMALFSFFHELSFLWTYLLMLITLFNRSKKMRYFILAIHCMRLPYLFIFVYHLWIVLISTSKLKK